MACKHKAGVATQERLPCLLIDRSLAARRQRPYPSSATTLQRSDPTQLHLTKTCFKTPASKNQKQDTAFQTYADVRLTVNTKVSRKGDSMERRMMITPWPLQPWHAVHTACYHCTLPVSKVWGRNSAVSLAATSQTGQNPQRPYIVRHLINSFTITNMLCHLDMQAHRNHSHHQVRKKRTLTSTPKIALNVNILLLKYGGARTHLRFFVKRRQRPSK